MTPLFGALRLPASVIFGSGQRAAIGMMTAQIGKRALICTDARLGGDAQFKAIVADIEANGVATRVSASPDWGPAMPRRARSARRTKYAMSIAQATESPKVGIVTGPKCRNGIKR